MIWNFIWGVVVVSLVASGLFDAISWRINIPILVVVVALWCVTSYNGLVRLRNRVREALSDIDVQLKRRFDLIPNFVSTVKGYTSHESGVLLKVTEARARVAQGGNAIERAGAENALSGTLKTLFAVAENYPDLKANTTFIELQRELSDTENKIQASRRFYNSMVLEINSAVHSFPTNILSGMFGFKEEKFFEGLSEAERAPVAVKF
ncbi:MAG: LemA family protein [Candidatus Pacebacteria bacterium]|nr:LemA family protein [Candidatus Paceibacterota bacterium]